MGGEAPVFARMTEATAGDVEATDFAATVATMKDLPNRVAICVCRGRMLTTIRLSGPGFRRVRAA